MKLLNKILDLTENFETNKGEEAELLSSDMGGFYPLLFRYKFGEYWYTIRCNNKGFPSNTSDSKIINSPKIMKVTGFLNVYREPENCIMHTTKKAALQSATKGIFLARGVELRIEIDDNGKVKVIHVADE